MYSQNNRPKIVDRSKAASYPLKPGVLYKCRVTYVAPNGQIKVFINNLGSEFGPILPIGTTKLNKNKVDDIVLGVFTDEFFKELIVLGALSFKDDVFADKKIVDQMKQTILSLTARIEALEA